MFTIGSVRIESAHSKSEQKQTNKNQQPGFAFLLLVATGTGRVAFWLASGVTSSFMHDALGRQTIFLEFWPESHFASEFFTFNWCQWITCWFLCVSLDLSHWYKSGKQVTCVHNADAKREKLFIYSLHDNQSPLVIPRRCRDTKVQDQCCPY